MNLKKENDGPENFIELILVEDIVATEKFENGRTVFLTELDSELKYHHRECRNPNNPEDDYEVRLGLTYGQLREVLTSRKNDKAHRDYVQEIGGSK